MFVARCYAICIRAAYVRWPTSDNLHPNQLAPHSHHNHTTPTPHQHHNRLKLVCCGCGVVVVSVWCELVWVKVVNCGPSYLCRRALFLWPSTRLRSVCLSRSCILSKRVPGNRIFIFSLSGSHVILVFPYQVPDSFRQPNQFCLDSPSHSLVNPSLLSSPLSSSITPSLFHSRLKTYLFNKSFPP